MIIELGTYGRRTVEPTVPFSNETGTKYCDRPGAEYHMLELAVPGVVMVTGLLETASPVPYSPTWLMGAGLHDPGWQMAYTEEVPGKLAVTAPVLLTVMSSWFVD